jgi:cytochrome P450
MKFNLHVLRMSWDHNMGLMRYGERWRYRRQICQQTFHKTVVKDYHSVMLQKVHAMLNGLLTSPEKFEHHNKMYATVIHL